MERRGWYSTYKDINPSLYYQFPYSFITFNNKILFIVTLLPKEWNWTDNRRNYSRTTIVKDINRAPLLRLFLAFYIIFWKQNSTATDAAHGNELWSTDGTAEGSNSQR